MQQKLLQKLVVIIEFGHNPSFWIDLSNQRQKARAIIIVVISILKRNMPLNLFQNSRSTNFALTLEGEIMYAA
jgi:hypothetical protein